jgi:hypothetical protein
MILARQRFSRQYPAAFGPLREPRSFVESAAICRLIASKVSHTLDLLSNGKLPEYVKYEHYYFTYYTDLSQQKSIFCIGTKYQH